MVNWSTFLVIPVNLSDEDRKRLQDADGWRSWVSRLTQEQQTELNHTAKFLIPSCRDIFMPTVDGRAQSCRWTTKTSPIKLLDARGQAVALVDWADLFWLPATQILLIKVTALNALQPEDLSLIAADAAQWHPRKPNTPVPQWRHGEKTIPLRELVLSQLLGLPADRLLEADDGVHWFGAAVPRFNLCHFPDGWPDDDTLATLIPPLGLWLPKLTPGYGPNDQTQSSILSSYVQDWENWRLYEWQNCATLILAGPPAFGQPENTEELYLLLFLAVCYQQVRLTWFVDTAATSKTALRDLRRDFADFRRRFLPNFMTTYPTGARIYGFLRKVNALPELQREIEEEIHTADELERLELGRVENATMVTLTGLAALFMPATLVTGIFGMNDPDLLKLNPYVWGAAIGVYALAIAAVLAMRGKRAGRLLSSVFRS